MYRNGLGDGGGGAPCTALVVVMGGTMNRSGRCDGGTMNRNGRGNGGTMNRSGLDEGRGGGKQGRSLTKKKVTTI